MDYSWLVAQVDEYLNTADRGQDGRLLDVSDRLTALEGVVDRILRETGVGSLGGNLSLAGDFAPGGYHLVQGHEKIARARAGRELLSRRADLDRALAPEAPSMVADKLHREVWASAAPFWRTAHYDQAVVAASQWLNADVQERLGVREPSDFELMSAAFSPKAGSMPRLMLPDATGTEQGRSRQRGLHHMAMGAYAGIRNPPSHQPQRWTQQEALERLAVFSLLAHWVDECEVDGPDADRE